MVQPKKCLGEEPPEVISVLDDFWWDLYSTQQRIVDVSHRKAWQACLNASECRAAAVVGSCTCGCCGPLVAKIAVLAAGPSIAAPLDWVFVDSASPLSALFIVGSIVLFAGSLIYSVEAAQRPDQSTSIAPAD